MRVNEYKCLDTTPRSSVRSDLPELFKISSKTNNSTPDENNVSQSQNTSVLFDDIDFCVLRRHLKRSKEESGHVVERSYSPLPKEVKTNLCNLLADPEVLYHGAPATIEKLLEGYKGIYGSEDVSEAIDSAIEDITTRRGIGKLIRKNENYAVALEIMKDYDSVFAELRGYGDYITPLEDKELFKQNSDIEKDSPLAKAGPIYEKKRLDDFLEEKGLDRREYKRLRSTLKRRYGEDLNVLRRFVKGWSVRDMDDDQKRSVYESWLSWNEEGNTKKDFVKDHNISSMYTLNKIISEYSA